MIRSAILLVSFFAVTMTGFAQDQKSPLAELPSPPGSHIEKIKAMGDNEWLNLGAPAADPKWGRARGSSWGAKALIFASDKRGGDASASSFTALNQINYSVLHCDFESGDNW